MEIPLNLSNSFFMRVVKRDGRHEKISFDKILKRIETLCETLKLDRIDAVEVTKDTINGLFDGITTEEIDHYAAVNCAEKIRDDPQYDKLASSLCISRLHKMTSKNFMDITNKLLNYEDKFGKNNPLITKQYYDFVEKNIDIIQATLDYHKDYDFDYFGYKTLERAYLHRTKLDSVNTENKKNKKNVKREIKCGNIIERPQHLLMRVAIALNLDNINDALETYDGLSKRYFIFGSPTLYNAGSKWQQLSSCFLLKMADNIEHIYDTIKEVALISKRAGGIGISMSDIRASGSLIRGTNGTSNGPVPFIQELNWTGRAVNQGGRRNGAIAIYLEPWHADIFHFCELRSNKGKEEERARDIFLALWIPNLFMKRVEQDGMWSLMCPDECPGLTKTYGNEFEELYCKYEKEKRFKKQIRAMDLWFHILSAQIENGMPYMLFKDNINQQSNHQNLGVIQSSNLCVSGDTYILTQKGQLQIKNLVNQNINIWNGKEWSNTNIMKTGTNKKLIKIKFSNGTYLKCTPEHKFYIMNNNDTIMIQANQLKINDKLIQHELPIINFNNYNYIDNELKYPYTQGFFSNNDGKTSISDIKYHKGYLYGENTKLLSYFDYVTYSEDNIEEFCYELLFHNDMNKNKNFVPINYPIKNKLKWFEGYCDANNLIFDNENLLISCYNDKEFLLKIRLMLQTMGCDSKICCNSKIKNIKFYNKSNYHLLILANDLNKLSKLGFSPNKLKFTINHPKQKLKFIKIVGIKKLEIKEDTFCFTENKRHMGIFNGILTGQCSEIVEYTAPDEIAVCNLSSICLPKFVEKNANGVLFFNFDKLLYVAGLVTLNLNKVIDINYYPVKNAKKSNIKHRPIGIGVQGLSDVFCMFDISYDSDEARILNRKIFETIYFGSLKKSMELAKKDGAYETFWFNGGCPFSKGKLQFHLWNLDESDLLMGFDWTTLINDIIKHGTRNSLLTTVMPTATTSQINGNTEACEPITTNVYTRSTLAGEFTIINKYLIEKLISLNLWNKEIRDELLYDRGSIQSIECIPNSIKAVYKTAFELKNKPIVLQAIERGPFIDQSQSLNLFCKIPDFEMLTSSHFYTWKNKLKTGLYYLRTQPAVDPMEFGLDIETIIQIEKKRNIIHVDNSTDNENDENNDNGKIPSREQQFECSGGGCSA